MSDWSNYDSDFDPTQKLENSDMSDDENEPLTRPAAKSNRPLESSSEEEISTGRK